MNSRERVYKAVHFQLPDRIPLRFMIGPAAQVKHGQAIVDIFGGEPDDFGEFVRLVPRTEWDGYYRFGDWVDEWGVRWHNAVDGLIGVALGCPLEDWKKFDGYQPRRLPAEEEIKRFDDVIESAGHQYFQTIIPSWDLQLFERMHYLRGFQRVMEDLATGSKEIYRLRDMIHELNMEVFRRLVRTHADYLVFQDDWGTQTSMLISPAAWRRFFKPCYAELFEMVRRSGKDLYFHSDGYVQEIMKDLVDIGVNIFNVQHSIMDTRYLGREFGGKVCFACYIDLQFVLPRGDRRQIFQEVARTVELLNFSGGGVIGIVYGDADTSLENVRWSLEAWRSEGKL